MRGVGVRGLKDLSNDTLGSSRLAGLFEREDDDIVWEDAVTKSRRKDSWNFMFMLRHLAKGVKHW